MVLNGLLLAKLNEICIGDILETSKIKPDFCRNETNNTTAWEWNAENESMGQNKQ